MGSDDAPHAGNDSGKHSAFSQGIELALPAARQRLGKKTCKPAVMGFSPPAQRMRFGGTGTSLKLIPARAPGNDAQVGTDPVSGHEA